MKKIIYKIFIICVFLLTVMNLIKIGENISKAATYTFNLTGPTTANVGDTLTFTITGNGLTGNVKLSGSNVNLSDSQIWVEKNSVTFTAKITTFPATVTATPVELTDNDYNIVSIPPKTITISEKKTEVPPTSNNNQNSNQGQTENNNQNSNQGQTGNNGQNSNQSQTGNNNQRQSSNVGQGSNQGNNNSNNSSGKTNNQGSLSQSNLNEQGNIKSSNNYLKNLEVNIGTLTPEFYRETYEYTIDNIIENEIQITAEAEDEKAIVNGIGTIALVGGENRINIEVIAENEQARTYTIIVNKLEEIIESDLRLSNLEIQTINEDNMFENLDIGFDKDKLEYEVTVEDNITDLSLQPTIDKEGVIVETKGDKNLKEGLNVVTITLTNQNSDNNMMNIDNNSNNEINQENDSNLINDVNITSDSFYENGSVKEQTVYIINVNRKAKPITEISSNGVENNKFVAGIILITLIVVLFVATIIAHKKRNKVKLKTKKYKRAK